MKNFTRLSQGTIKRSFAQLMIRDYYQRIKTIAVPVPLSISHDMLLFDFQTEIERIPEFEKISREQIKSVVSVLGKSIGSLKSGWIEEVLREQGFADTTIEARIFLELEKSIISALGRSGITSMVVKDVLQTAAGGAAALENPEKLNMESIAESVARIQSLYSKFAQSESVEAISAYLSETVGNDPLCSFANSLYTLFHLTSAPSAPVNLGYVLNSFYRQAFDEDMFEEVAIVPGYEYRLTGVNIGNDLTYGDSMFISTWALRVLMGITSDVQTLDKLNIHDLLAIQATGGGITSPFMVDTLSFEADRASKIFLRVFLCSLVEKIASGNFGTLEARIRNVIDSRKYERSDAYDRLIKNYLSVTSAVFETFLDTAAFFRELTTDYSIHFPDIDGRLQKRINDFTYSFYGSFKAFNYPTTHPRFLMEPALLVNHTRVLPTGNDEFYVAPETKTNALQSAVMVNDNLSLAVYLKTDVIKGDPVDLKINVPLPILNLATSHSPVYYSTTPKPELLKSELGAAFFSIMPLSSLVKITRNLDWYLDQGNLIIVNSVGAMQNIFNLPLTVAQRLFKHPEVYIDFSKIPQSIVTYEYDLAPIYEVSVLEDENLLVRQFIAPYPYLLGTVDAFTIKAAVITTATHSMANPGTTPLDPATSGSTPEGSTTSTPESSAGAEGGATPGE